MPFRSVRQMKFLFARHPDIAKRWASEGYGTKGLPERVGKPSKSGRSTGRISALYAKEKRT